MRTHRFQQGTEMLEVTLTPLQGAADGRVSARVVRVVTGGEQRSETTLDLDARRIGDAHYLARLAGGEIVEARVESEAGGGPGRVVRFGPEHVQLDWLDPFAVATGGKSGGRSGPRKISSPIPGRVVSIAVAVDDEVEIGQSVVVVEAMKMANELRTPIAGRVKSISAKPGDRVEAGVTLAIIEPR